MDKKTWEYKTTNDWKLGRTVWLNKHKPTSQQKRLLESFELYLNRLLLSDIPSGRFRYETNGKLHTIMYRLHESVRKKKECDQLVLHMGETA
jgi:hypothetical protein